MLRVRNGLVHAIDVDGPMTTNYRCGVAGCEILGAHAHAADIRQRNADDMGMPPPSSDLLIDQLRREREYVRAERDAAVARAERAEAELERVSRSKAFNTREQMEEYGRERTRAEAAERACASMRAFIERTSVGYDPPGRRAIGQPSPEEEKRDVLATGAGRDFVPRAVAEKLAVSLTQVMQYVPHKLDAWNIGEAALDVYEETKR